MKKKKTGKTLVVAEPPKKLPPPINISEVSRALAKAELAEEVIDINDRIARAERIMIDSGMYREDEVREVNEYRMRARWKLGGILKKLDKQTVISPGRGGKSKKGRPVSIIGTSKVESLGKLQLEGNAARQAERINAMPQSEQERSFRATRKDETLNSYASQEKWARPWWYKESRGKRHKDIADAAKAIDLGNLGPFPLIYADPPWKFATYSPKGLEKTPDQHYPTLTDAEIADFKVGGLFVREIAAKSAALLMWCTSSNFHRALEIMEAWDFEYKTHAVWVKTKGDGKIWTGTGLVFRNAHECLLYGTRGNMPGPQYQPPSVFMYPRGRHSEKPDPVRREIEKMYPDFDETTRTELFARDQYKGWTCHGFEALSKVA